MKTGGELLVDCLKAQNVERVFSVPGESYLAVLDGLYQSGIQNIVARQEGGAAMMAEADGKLTGRPGIAMVTRGPGACNASAGVHIAKQDSTPMILFVGQIGRDMKGREAFQEVDYRAMFTDLAKWVEEIDDANRIPEIISHAYHVAMSGRPGPVVLALPEDMLRDATDALAGPYVVVASPAPTPQVVDTFAALLKKSKKPLLLLGGSRWNDEDVEKCQEFSARTGLPVGCTFRRHALFDNEHPNYLGDIGFSAPPALKAAFDEADLLILLGCRFSEVPSGGFELLDIPKPQKTLVHIHPGPEELGRIYAPDLSINATPGAFLDAVSDMEAGFQTPNDAHQSYLTYSTPEPAPSGQVDNNQVMADLKAELSADTIMTNGAGNYAIWLQRYWRVKKRDGYLGPISGSMGYGLPAAVAAKARHPERTIVCFAGDGCFQMTSQEFGTAVQNNLAVIVLIFDNGSYGTIRMHQEKRYPDRVSGTEIKNPNFAEIAKAYGVFGERIERTEDFKPALRRAIESNGPAILHILNDVDVISPSLQLSSLHSGKK